MQTITVALDLFWCVCFRVGFLNCDDICMCFVNKRFALCEFVFEFVDRQYNEISPTFTTGSVSLCCICSHVVVFGVSVSLSCYSMWMRWLL